MDRLGRIFGLLAALLAADCIAPSAFAADLALPSVIAPPPPAPAWSWTGIYVGGDVGAVFTSARFNQPMSGLSDIAIGSIDSRPTYGFYGGANYQFLPWLVAGIEYSNTKFSEADYRELGPALDFLEQANHIDSIDGRLGIVLSPRTMIYGKAGFAHITVQGFEGFGTPFRQTLPGVQTGVGIETLVTPYITLRAEASYTYADHLLALNSDTDLYRPGFLLVQLGLSLKLDPTEGWGTPAATWPTTASPALVYKAPAMVTKAPPPAQPYAAVPYSPNWTGFDAGGFVSADGNKVKFNDTLGGEIGPFTDFVFGGGWFAGANYQFQEFVVGGEFSADYEAAKFNTAAGSGGLAGNFFNFAKIDRTLAATGRIGWLEAPDTLLYVKAGPSWMRLTPDHNFFNSIAPNNTEARNFPGYQAGIGAETYVTRNLSVRLEGLYTNTGKRVVLNGTVPNEFALQPSILSATLGLALHI